MQLHLISMVFAVVNIAFIHAIPLFRSESSVSNPTGIISRMDSDKPTVLISFQNPGPEGTKDDEAVAKIIDLLFDDAARDTKGLIPQVKPIYENHIDTGRKTITIVPFTFTGLDICHGKCTAEGDIFQKISWIKDSTGKPLYKQDKKSKLLWTW
ncbi:hypothetical protein J3R30DRAFT_3699110 [Lentinula aciculospora]|uniref:Uncharacterized protein n=1 Tax=Lentinula aciculospora TaxID=153920 RepID=A0A9W9AGF7_9AGAR|nr:hypothetical protein J3R30DRAFT_3699110 [Lentinula aciculospora]